jgi:hypothetical protein
MSVVAQFQKHVESVNRLMNFDRDVLSFAIAAIEELEERLKQHHQLDNPHLSAGRTLHMLRQYREHDSLRPRYETIFNQALVLLVSYFGSSVHDLFRKGVNESLVAGKDPTLLKEQVKLSLSELREADFDLRDMAADLLVNAKDISFQDMKSIARAFQNHLNVTILQDKTINEIILAQACRHVIVHAGGIVNAQTIRQVSVAKPRAVKSDLALHEGKAVQFTVDEIQRVAASMETYLRNVEQLLATHKSAT